VRLTNALKEFDGEDWGELLLGVAQDFAIGQRFLQLVNVCLGEVGVVYETQYL